MELCLNIPGVIIYYVSTRGNFSFHRILYSIGIIVRARARACVYVCVCVCVCVCAFSQMIKYSVTK
jgi:hypothetical protein